MEGLRSLFPRPCAAPVSPPHAPPRCWGHHPCTAPPFTDPRPAVASGSFPRSRQPQLRPHWPQSPPPLLGATYSSCSGLLLPLIWVGASSSPLWPPSCPVLVVPDTLAPRGLETAAAAWGGKFGAPGAGSTEAAGYALLDRCSTSALTVVAF